MKMSFNYLEIRFDLDARELQIGMDNRYNASRLSDFLKNNWDSLFSHELRGCIGVYPGSYDYADETCYVKIDWYGTKEKLQDISYELTRYSKGYANLLRTDKYLEFDTCKNRSSLPLTWDEVTLRTLKFGYTTISHDPAPKKIDIYCINADTAELLKDFFDLNWNSVFPQSDKDSAIFLMDDGGRLTIDWWGTREKLNDIYEQLLAHTRNREYESRGGAYLEFYIREGDIKYLDTDKAYSRITAMYHYDSRPISAAVAKVKIEEPDYQIYALPGRRNGKGMIMANNNNLEIAHHSYTKAFYAKLANNLYGYQLLSSIDSNNDIRDCIKKVQINEKKKVVTIVWKFGEPTIARCGKNDVWDPEKGILVCIAKHLFVSGTQMNKWLKEQIPEPESEDYIPKHAKEAE